MAAKPSRPRGAARRRVGAEARGPGASSPGAGLSDSDARQARCRVPIRFGLPRAGRRRGRVGRARARGARGGGSTSAVAGCFHACYAASAAPREGGRARDSAHVGRGPDRGARRRLAARRGSATGAGARVGQRSGSASAGRRTGRRASGRAGTSARACAARRAAPSARACAGWRAGCCGGAASCGASWRRSCRPGVSGRRCGSCRRWGSGRGGCAVSRRWRAVVHRPLSRVGRSPLVGRRGLRDRELPAHRNHEDRPAGAADDGGLRESAQPCGFGPRDPRFPRPRAARSPPPRPGVGSA